MEYLELGDLDRYITPALKEDDARIITSQILDGLEVLHRCSWALRELKPQNIFVVEQGPHWWVKIGDFGITKSIIRKTVVKRAELQGTIALIEDKFSNIFPPEIHTQVVNNTLVAGSENDYNYMAPEILSFFRDGDGDPSRKLFSYSKAVDIWSLGCILHRLLTQQLPFSSHKACWSYCRLGTPFPTDALIHQQISEDCIELLQQMLQPSPQKRLTAAQALTRKWFETAHSYTDTTTK
jgi:serine/threonine protein kinase